MNKPKTASGYLHGFTKTEQDRLLEQAKILEASTFASVDLKKNRHCLEVGCGVGAQTQILLKRFPKLKITAIDASDAQLSVAKARLAKEVKKGRVEFHKANALELPFKNKTFDSAFFCWILEHVSDPVGILKEVRRTLKPGAQVVLSEVFNDSIFLTPHSPALTKYWAAFNAQQIALDGDPYIGVKLGNYLLEAGYKKIDVQMNQFHYDNREPKKRLFFLEYFKELILSAEPELLKSGRVDEKTVSDMKKEIEVFKSHKEAVFFGSWVRATAKA